MSTFKPRTHIVIALVNFVVREREDSVQDSSGSRLLLVEAFVSRYEQAGYDTRPVGRDVDVTPTDQARYVPNHCERLTGHRACCNVERRASVDSVPWLRLAPFLSRPSKAPPVAWSHMTTPASLSPRNQLAAAVIPSTHLWWTTTAVGAGTGICEGRHLNGLLVETRTFVIGTIASHGSDREMTVLGLPGEQPFQELQTVLHEGRTLEQGAGRDHRFGERCVRVGQARFWPKPPGLSTGCGHGVGRIGQKGEGSHVVAIDTQHLGCPQRRECHGPGPRRAPPHRSLEPRRSQVAYQVVVAL